MITKIHSKYYDLSKFNHPGGRIPIELTDGRDATELFEAHHLLSDKTKIMRMLEKYEIPIENVKEPIEDNNDYDWVVTLDSEFTKEMMTLIRSHVKFQDMKASWQKWTEISVLFGIYIINWYYYLAGNYYALGIYPLSLWIFTVNIYHDASHFALSHNPLINRLGTYTALMFSLTYTWYHQHVIGHHCYTNIITKDPDLYHSPKYVRHTPNIRKNGYHKYQNIIAWPIWMVAVPIGLVLTGFMRSIKQLPYNKIVKLSKALDQATMYYEFTFVIIYMVIIPYIATNSWLFVIYPYIAYSFLFMICTQINHLTEETLDETIQDKNYFIHQIINSHNVAPQSYLMYLFTGGLNLQIEHHLMPSVNHCHLRKIQPKIEQLCRKYGIHYACSNSLWEALMKHYKHICRYTV